MKNRKLNVLDVVSTVTAEATTETADHTGGGEGLAAAAAALGVVTKEQAAAEKAHQVELMKAPAGKLIEARKEIKISKLIESKKNHRKDFGDVSALGESMLAQGQLTALQVVKVNPEVYEVISGARRLRAGKKAGMQTLACDVYEATAEQLTEMRVAENLHRKDLAPIEEAEQLGELGALGYTPATMAKRLDMSIGWVHSRLKLLKLGPAARSLANSGRLPSSLATPIARLPSHALQAQALEAIERQGLVSHEDPKQGYEVHCKWGDEGANVAVRKAIDLVLHNFTRSLKSPGFDMEDETLVTVERATKDFGGGGGACSTCPNNSANMPDADDDAKGHSFCSLVPCFEAKKEAAWATVSAKAEEKGAEVLSLEESKQTRYATGIDHSFGASYGERFVAATAKPANDPKKRTYGQLVNALPEADRPAETLVAGEGKASAVKLYERKDIEKALGEVHAWAKKRTERSSAKPAESKEAKAKRQRMERVSLESLRQVLAAIRKKAPAVGELRALALAAIDMGDSYELQNAVEKSCEGDGMANLFGMKSAKELNTWVEKKAKPSDLIAVLYAFTMGNSFANAYGGYSAEVKEATTRHKVDLKKLEKLDETATAEPAAKA